MGGSHSAHRRRASHAGVRHLRQQDIITVRQAARIEATGRVRARAIAIDTMQNKNPRSSAGVLV
ncbi:hypothetical protein XAP412_470068 [Xanthomonas phaseoli pv. phaseoli]|uniref:Uncharacterized protein n=1 Tax=Xanthomonas campestris pv. phaseoli TaxID=317013 RepID=A0AB38E2K0_XANCH|nr:hypothetical protein XAP6984_520069 [Xanthomonas phaseoli pv. phaseoli]SON86247.1 hypothetical protein XAP412_470068 [Xanthomonas phaseoli pv. phaseoli]SON90547.1 hypothetical protein XAP7430_480117 [Xanthomonas phaseoli pv. phaseoli]SOO28240.1 hypothetical protein XAP6164_2250014 [Xanthomonas phaseoli pv. phaseoli]